MKTLEWVLNLINRVDFLLRIKIHGDGVYILTYHGLVSDKEEFWEQNYEKVMTHVETFKCHIDYLLLNGFIPIKLSDLSVFKFGTKIKGKFFAITFDDGYSNTLSIKDYLYNLNIYPTVFVNGSFCENDVYYRVKAATLCSDEHLFQYLREDLSQNFPEIAWSTMSSELFNQIKNNYVPIKTEKIVGSCFHRSYGPIDFKPHLDLNELKLLSKFGWEFANHTWSHQNLNKLNYHQIDQQLFKNIDYFESLGLVLLSWIGIPNGRSLHVNEEFHTWAQNNSDFNIAFASGGVNLSSSKLHWLRIPVYRESVNDFKKLITKNWLASYLSAPFVTIANKIYSKLMH